MVEAQRPELGERPNKRARLDDGDKGFISATESLQNEQERAVGITHFVSPYTSGFSCVVKQRYTDFLVNEILPDGTLLRLTEYPESLQRSERDKEPRAVNNKNKPEIVKNDGFDAQNAKFNDSTPSKDTVEMRGVSSEDMTMLSGIFGEDTSSKILHLYDSVLNHPDRKRQNQPVVKSGVIAEKSKRTEAHVAIRRIFKSKLETATLQDEGGVIAVRAASITPTQSSRDRDIVNSAGASQKGKLAWDNLGGEWLHFTLYKENKDTMEILYFIASQIKVHVKNFQFAGTKDRRGVTTQRIAVFRIRAERIAGLQKYAKGWVAGGFAYKKYGLELGELMGNEFKLTLRDVRVAEKEADYEVENKSQIRTATTEAAEAFKSRGFINYYGLQRFGTFNTGTHIVGMKMLQGDLEGAIDSILSYSSTLLKDAASKSKAPQDDIDRAYAIHSWRHTGRSGEALSKLPKRFQSEVSIIQYLSKVDKRTGELVQMRDWQGALMTIQRNMRLMYVHAYQSLVWNVVAGKRWEMYGDVVLEGDLVIVGEKDGCGNADKKDAVDDDGEPIVHPSIEDQSAFADDRFTRARSLNKAEVESGRFDIFDIVLPLPGFDVEYPANAIGKFYEDFMASDEGGKLDPHKMRRAWKDISLSGGYRKLLARPGKDFNIELREYAEENEQLVETDLERLKREARILSNGIGEEGASLPKDCVLNHEENGDDDDDDHEAKQKRVAIVMKLQLGSSQYATIALRELTKGGATNYQPGYFH